MNITKDAENGGPWEWRDVTINGIDNHVSLRSCLRACWENTEHLQVFYTD